MREKGGGREEVEVRKREKGEVGAGVGRGGEDEREGEVKRRNRWNERRREEEGRRVERDGLSHQSNSRFLLNPLGLFTAV